MIKKIEKHLKSALPTIIGVSVVFLGIRYMGHLPVVNDIAKGAKGDTTKFNWTGIFGGVA